MQCSRLDQRGVYQILWQEYHKIHNEFHVCLDLAGGNRVSRQQHTYHIMTKMWDRRVLGTPLQTYHGLATDPTTMQGRTCVLSVLVTTQISLVLHGIWCVSSVLNLAIYKRHVLQNNHSDGQNPLNLYTVACRQIILKLADWVGTVTVADYHVKILTGKRIGICENSIYQHRLGTLKLQTQQKLQNCLI